RAVPLGEAVGVGELAQLPAVELVRRARHGTMPALGPGVLADARRGVARALAGLALAFDAALARLEDVRVRVGGTVAEGGREAELMGYRRARLAVPDLLLHEHTTLERGPRHLVGLLGRVVLGVEAERGARAVGHAGVLEPVRRAGHDETGLAGGEVGDR